MTAKKSDYIIIYCFLFASILCIAVFARLFVVRQLQMDDFSSTVAFVVACLLFGAAYFSFQSIVNEWLQPAVERIFRKKHPHLKSEPQIESTTEAPQEESTVNNYNEYKLTTQQKIQQEQEQILENVLTYTRQKLSLYMTESDSQQLCEPTRFFQFATEKECEQINTPVTVDARLNSIDLVHFGWNIGNQFKKSGIETATFIKQVFAAPFEKIEISTIKHKLRVERTCKIKLTEEIEPNVQIKSLL